MANYVALAFAVLRGHLLVGVLVGDLLVAAVLTKHFRCCTLVKTKGSDMGKPTPVISMAQRIMGMQGELCSQSAAMAPPE